MPDSLSRRRALGRAAALVCAVLPALALVGCTAEGGTPITVDNGLAVLLGDRCRSVPDGADGTLEGVFDVEWDAVTFAQPGALYDDLAAASGASFDEALSGHRVTESTLVLSHDGHAVLASEADGFPVQLATPTTLLQTIDAPGAFVRDGSACAFAA